jgi:hypothetical protein
MMGSRERRRAERRKRKQRSAGRQGGGEPAAQQGGRLEAEPAAENGGGPEPEPAGRAAAPVDVAALSRSERRNAEAREALEPLREGERPLVVTLAAVLATLLFVATLAGWALWDVLRDDARPPTSAVLLFAAIVGVMAAGLWGARYWAVLGFQTLLLFPILGSVLGIVQATTILQALGNLAIIAVAGTLFYFMVKGLARIQMPERAPRD